MLNNSPKPMITFIKAIMLHTAGVQAITISLAFDPGNVVPRLTPGAAIVPFLLVYSEVSLLS